MHHPKDDIESDYPVRDAALSYFIVLFELLQLLLDSFTATFSTTSCADTLALRFESTFQMPLDNVFHVYLYQGHHRFICPSSERKLGSNYK